MSEEKLAPNFSSLTLQEIVAVTGGELLRGNMSTQCSGVSSDTRTVSANNLFVALRGENFDAHQFLEQAATQGAIAAIVDHEANAPTDLALIRVENTLHALGNLARYHRRRFDIPVIGVTGSYGKTTTRALIATALRTHLSVLSSAANFNNEIGVPLTLFGLDENHHVAVIEMGMRGLQQIEYLAQVAEPTIGVVTNIGPQHIEMLGGIENIARAKAELIEALPSHGVAIIPADDQYSLFLRERAKCRVVTFGQSEDSDYRATRISNNSNGHISFSLRDPQSKTHDLTLPMPGAHNAINAAAALAVCGVLEIPLADAANALQSVEVPGARMRIVRNGGITIIDDCYNAGPTSMRAALEMLRDFPNAKRRVAVLGAMKELGGWSQTEHRKIGEIVSMSQVEILFGVGDETRDLLDAASLLSTHKQWFADASSAANAVRDAAREGDVILVKGSRSVGLEVVVNTLANR